MIHINSKNINFKNLDKKLSHTMQNTQKRVSFEKKQPLLQPQQKQVHQERYLRKDLYEINDFIQYNNETFIDYCYFILLRRDADAEGLAHYLHLLHSGERTKLDILLAIRFSPEGKQNGVNILGVKKRLLRLQLYKLPLLGYLIKTVETLLRMPKLLKRVNSLEALLATKVTSEKLHELSQALSTEVDKKVNLDDFHKDMQTKVEREIFYTEIDKKVNIPEFQQEINKKVNLEDFHKEISMRVDSDTFNTEINKKVNLDDFHKEFHKQTQQIELFAKDLQTANNYLKYVENNLQKLIQKAETTIDASSSTHNTLIHALKEEKEHILDALYLSFEDKFRGAREEIKKRQEYYLPLVKESIDQENGTVLDIGCGRGEWLELLKDNNIKAKGLDLNRLMVETAKEYGLDVTNGDAIAYLKSLESASLDAITAFHIVEHLPFDTLISLFDESLRVLKKGGIIIFETPNPENLFVGSCSFYTDPTHKNPIPPVTLEFLAHQRGFKEVEIHRLHPLKEIRHNSELREELNHLIAASATAQDYSIIGKK